MDMFTVREAPIINFIGQMCHLHGQLRAGNDPEKAHLALNCPGPD